MLPGTGRPSAPRERKPSCGMIAARLTARSKSVPAMCTPWLARMSRRRSIPTFALLPASPGSAGSSGHAAGNRPQDREIRRAAADVGHQHQLLALDARLVVERGGNRFVLEHHLTQARIVGRGGERALGLGVALSVAVDEVHRPPDHRPGRQRAAVAARAFQQVAQVSGHDIGVAHRPPRRNCRGLADQVRTQDALDRAHQAPVAAVDIGGDRRIAEAHAAVGAIEHCGRHAGGSVLEIHQLDSRTGDPGDRRVRRAEIDRADRRRCRRHGAGG